MLLRGPPLSPGVVRGVGTTSRDPLPRAPLSVGASAAEWEILDGKRVDLQRAGIAIRFCVVSPMGRYSHSVLCGFAYSTVRTSESSNERTDPSERKFVRTTLCALPEEGASTARKPNERTNERTKARVQLRPGGQRTMLPSWLPALAIATRPATIKGADEILADSGRAGTCKRLLQPPRGGCSSRHVISGLWCWPSQRHASKAQSGFGRSDARSGRLLCSDRSTNSSVRSASGRVSLISLTTDSAESSGFLALPSETWRPSSSRTSLAPAGVEGHAPGMPPHRSASRLSCRWHCAFSLGRPLKTWTGMGSRAKAA